MDNEHWKQFRGGVRVLMLIHRAKDGGTGTQRKSKKIITTDQDSFDKALQELQSLKKEGMRIYSTVNARSMTKAIRELKRQQLDADYFDKDSMHRFYIDIKNRWISCLMKPSSREDYYFIVDVDDGLTLEQVLHELNEHKVEILVTYATKNGHHVVVKPFNVGAVSFTDSIKKDDLLLIEY